MEKVLIAIKDEDIKGWRAGLSADMSLASTSIDGLPGVSILKSDAWPDVDDPLAEGGISVRGIPMLAIMARDEGEGCEFFEVAVSPNEEEEPSWANIFDSDGAPFYGIRLDGDGDLGGDDLFDLRVHAAIRAQAMDEIGIPAGPDSFLLKMHWLDEEARAGSAEPAPAGAYPNG